MTKQDMNQVDAVNNLFNGVMQYFVLPPKREREEKQFARWTDEAFRVFGFNEKEDK